MNICIYTVHLFLYECITCKVVWSVTVHSVSITWCKLWQQFGWQLLYCNPEGCTSYVCHIFLSKVQIYTLLYVGYLLKETVFKMFELLRIWSISQFLAAPFSHCKAMIDNIISSDMHFCHWPLLPLFCLCTLPCILTPLLPLSCTWPWSFSECSSIVRICNSCVVLCLYMLSNWRIIRCTFELFQITGLSLGDLHSLH